LKLTTFADTNSVYSCSNELEVTRHIARHRIVREFMILFRNFEKMIESDIEDSYLDSVLRPLRLYRFRLASLPVHLSSSFLIPTELSETLKNYVPRCRNLFPHYFNELEKLAEAARLTIGCNDAPLLDIVKNIVTQDGPRVKKAILVRRLPNLELCGELKRKIGASRIELVTPATLRSAETYGHIIAIGPLSWFPSHVRTAPRSSKMSIVHFDWLRDQNKLQPSFISSSNKIFEFSSNSAYVAELNSLETLPDTGQVFDESEPNLDWQSLHMSNVLEMSPENGNESLSSRLLLLSANKALYVDSSSGAKSYIIEQVKSGSTIGRVLNEALEPGMFILIRTGGGGSLIVPMADKILGSKAQDIRLKQKQWKKALFSHIQQKGEQSVIRLLRELGCKRASLFNLKNWMGDKTIRPEFDEDFLAVLLICGLDSEFNAFADNARLIDRVHRIAGFKIRRMLLDRINKADIGKLLEDGIMEFDLPGVGGGSFTAYRVEDISPQVFLVPTNHLNHPFEVSEKWLG